MLLGSLIASELVAAVVVFPGKVNSILAMNEELTTTAKDVAGLKQATTYLNSLDEKILAGQVDRVTAVLPDEKKTSGLVTGLNDLAAASGVILKDINFSPGLIASSSGDIDVGSGVKAIPVGLSVSGELTSLTDFVSRVQTATQLLGATDLNYNLADNPAGGTVSLIVYYLPPQNGVTSWQSMPTISEADKKLLGTFSSVDLFTLPTPQR